MLAGRPPVPQRLSLPQIVFDNHAPATSPKSSITIPIPSAAGAQAGHEQEVGQTHRARFGRIYGRIAIRAQVMRACARTCAAAARIAAKLDVSVAGATSTSVYQ